MQEKIDRLIARIGEVVLGKEREVELACCCLLSGGHLLIEDLPGMGKTTLARSLATGLGLQFTRIQFTSDLLPADIIGCSVYEKEQAAFVFHRGPVFTQLLLADEINRASPRTQSALLEAMEERQVSVEGETRALPEPFFVIATQNPVSMAGTFALPESQMDRFLMSLQLGYPDHDNERELLKSTANREAVDLMQCLSANDLKKIARDCQSVHCSEALLDYAQALIAATRNHASISLGLSPRGAQALMRSARTLAFMHGRDHVIPEDLQQVFPAVSRHRILLVGNDSSDASAMVLNDILENTAAIR